MLGMLFTSEQWFSNLNLYFWLWRLVKSLHDFADSNGSVNLYIYLCERLHFFLRCLTLLESYSSTSITLVYLDNLSFLFLFLKEKGTFFMLPDECVGYKIKIPK